MNLENIYYTLTLADHFQCLFICSAIALFSYGNLLKEKDIAFIFSSVTKPSNRGILGSSDLQEMHLQIQIAQFRLCAIFIWATEVSSHSRPVYLFLCSSGIS